MENQVQEQTLKAGAIGRGEITLMAVAGAAPVMCIGGSMHTFLSQTGTGISLAAAMVISLRNITTAVVLILISPRSSAKKLVCGACSFTTALCSPPPLARPPFSLLISNP